MKPGFRRFRTASTAVAHSAVWVPKVAGGLLPSIHRTPGPDTGPCTALMVEWAAATTISQAGSLSAASRTNLI